MLQRIGDDGRADDYGCVPVRRIALSMLMILPTVSAPTMLADLRDTAWSAASWSVTGSGSWLPSRATVTVRL